MPQGTNQKIACAIRCLQFHQTGPWWCPFSTRCQRVEHSSIWHRCRLLDEAGFINFFHLLVDTMRDDALTYKVDGPLGNLDFGPPDLHGSSVGEASARQTGHCPEASKDAVWRVTRDSRTKGFPNVAEVFRISYGVRC